VYLVPLFYQSLFSRIEDVIQLRERKEYLCSGVGELNFETLLQSQDFQCLYYGTDISYQLLFNAHLGSGGRIVLAPKTLSAGRQTPTHGLL
jgi:hypothetical protein